MPDAGPPRFMTVGESVLLSPRGASLSETYEWSIRDAPADSEATVSDDAIVEFDPDIAGVYRLRLHGPEGWQDLTVRVYDGVQRDVRFSVHRSRLNVPEEQLETVSICGHFCSLVEGQERPTIGDEYLYYDTRVPPGEHPFYMTTADRSAEAWDTTIVPGPRRPRISLDGDPTPTGAQLEAEVFPPENADGTADDLDVEFYVDDRDDATVTADGRTATVRLADESARVYAVAVGERPSVADAVRITREGVTPLDEPPSWVRDAVVYSVNIRWFAKSLRAFELRLDYLDRLGIDCLYLLPIQRNDGETHGYNIVDFFAVDDDLGTQAAFEQLVESCHERGIRVIIDLVANHSAREHPKFDPERPTPDGEGLYAWVDGEAESYYDWDDVANFDMTSVEARALLRRVVEYWAPLVDGFRCDAVHCLPPDFWKEVRSLVSDDQSDFLLLSEELPYDARSHEQEFDVHYDNILSNRLTEIGKGNMPATSLLDVPSKRRRSGMPPRATFLQYVDTHDSDPYQIECDASSLRAAVAATFCLPGVPMIYAGQEMGHEDSRGPVPWRRIDTRLLEFHRRLVECWRELPPLRRGTLEPVNWDAASSDVVAFAREYRGERVVVVLNFGEDPVEVSLDEQVSTDFWTGALVGSPLRVTDVAILASGPPPGQQRRDGRDDG